MPSKRSPLSSTWAMQVENSGVPRKLHVTYIFEKQVGEEGKKMFRDNTLGEKIQRSFSPTITSTMMTSVKQKDKTERGSSKSCRKEDPAGQTRSTPL